MKTKDNNSLFSSLKNYLNCCFYILKFVNHVHFSYVKKEINLLKIKRVICLLSSQIYIPKPFQVCYYIFAFGYMG